jgi:molybdopterin converting factor small subunit
MRVKVKFRYGLRRITRVPEEDLELPDGSTFASLLETLTKIYGKPFKDFIYDERTGQPSMYYQFTIDGRNVHSLGGFHTRLKGGETVDMLIPVVGG